MAVGLPLVLVADDQPGVRRLLAAVCRQAGCRVAEAAGGQEALALAAREEPDLVLLDLCMPGMDGLMALRALRARLPGVPVIILTAGGDAGAEAAARALGVYGILQKPFDVRRLKDLIRSALGQGGGHTIKEEDSPSPGKK